MRNPELPKGWRECRLGDVAKYRTGKLNSNAATNNGDYPFFTCSPITAKIDTFAFDEESLILAGNNANGIFSLKYYNGKFNAYQRTYVINTLQDYKFLCGRRQSTSGQWGGLAPTAHRTVRTGPYTAPHVKRTNRLS